MSVINKTILAAVLAVSTSTAFAFWGNNNSTTNGYNNGSGDVAGNMNFSMGFSGKARGNADTKYNGYSAYDQRSRYNNNHYGNGWGDGNGSGNGKVDGNFNMSFGGSARGKSNTNFRGRNDYVYYDNQGWSPYGNYAPYYQAPITPITNSKGK